jgi:hypothetical protein
MSNFEQLDNQKIAQLIDKLNRKAGSRKIELFLYKDKDANYMSSEIANQCQFYLDNNNNVTYQIIVDVKAPAIQSEPNWLLIIEFDNI